MEAYRLYTVVPRLVELIDQLTNWYIRMNKDRFSGERGAGERRTSLCTLFEVLMMLCRMMAPLTPFFAEHVYQNLRRVVPDAPASVHFLMIPEVNEAAIDPQMEADVRLMLQVIEKGRTLRERRALSTRTPNRRERRLFTAASREQAHALDPHAAARGDLRERRRGGAPRGRDAARVHRRRAQRAPRPDGAAR